MLPSGPYIAYTACWQRPLSDLKVDRRNNKGLHATTSSKLSTEQRWGGGGTFCNNELHPCK